jgi:hypothetical protein
LVQTESATNDDIESGLVRWVQFFKAKTWKELIMIASDNKYMQSAAEAVYLTENDYHIAMAALDREAFLRRQARKDAKIEEQAAEIERQAAEIECLRALLAANGIKAD